MQDLDYCRDKAAPEGSDLYYCLLFTSETSRAGLLALFALKRELEEVVEGCSDASVARRKLQYWHQELLHPEPHGVAHPVSRALRHSGAMEHLDETARASLLHGTARRISTPQILDDATLRQLCDATAGELVAAASRICGARQEHEETARELGIAVERARLVHLPRRAGTPPHTAVPLDLIARHGARPDEIDRGAKTPGASALREALLLGARDALEAAMALQLPAPGPVRGLAWMAHAHVQSLARSGFAQHARGSGITPLRKLWIAWRQRDRTGPTSQHITGAEDE